MKIKKMLSQHRRDFQAIYVCESCGHEETKSGYDDNHFHKEVVPKMKCKKCKEISPNTYIPKSTKYKDGQSI